jgi:O-antigen ligase
LARSGTLTPSLRRGGGAVAPVVAAALAGGAAAAVTTVLPSTIVAAAVIGLVAVLAVRMAPWAALVTLAATRASLEGTYTMSLVSVGGVRLSPADLLTLAFLGGTALYLFGRMRATPSLLSAPTVAPALAFVGWAAVTLSYSPDWALGARDLLKFLAAYSAFLVVVAQRPDPTRIKQLLAAVVIGAIPPIAYGYVVGGNDINVFSGWARSQSLFDSANTYGFYLVTVLAAVWALRQRVSGAAARAATTAVGVAALVAVLLTLSRNSFAAMSLLVLVVGWRQRRVLIAVLAVAAIVLLTVPQTLARGTEFFSSEDGSAENSLTGRIGIWEEGARLWRTQPVVGRGWGTTSLTVGKNTHNDYLRTLIESGAIGLVSYVVLVWSLIKMGRRAAAGRADSARAALGLGFGYALVSLASNSLGKGVFQFHFWLVVGLLYVWSETISDSASPGSAAGANPPPPTNEASTTRMGNAPASEPADAGSTRAIDADDQEDPLRTRARETLHEMLQTLKAVTKALEACRAERNAARAEVRGLEHDNLDLKGEVGKERELRARVERELGLLKVDVERRRLSESRFAGLLPRFEPRLGQDPDVGRALRGRLGRRGHA